SDRGHTANCPVECELARIHMNDTAVTRLRETRGRSEYGIARVDRQAAAGVWHRNGRHGWFGIPRKNALAASICARRERAGGPWFHSSQLVDAARPDRRVQFF